MNFCWNLKFVSCERICSKENNQISPLPLPLKCLSTFNCWYCGCQMCWRYTLTVSWFSFSFLCLCNTFLLTCVTDYNISKVKTIACEVVFQFKSNMSIFKGLVIIYQQHSHLLSLQLNVPDKTWDCSLFQYFNLDISHENPKIFYHHNSNKTLRALHKQMNSPLFEGFS